MFVNEAMNQSLEMVQNVWECITRSNSSLVALKLIGILQREALHYFEALGIALKELEQEKIAANKILLKLQKSSDNLKEKDMEINSLRHEVSRQIQKHEVLSKELANAGAEVSNLNKKLSGAENLLEKERKSLSAARDGLEKLDHALLNEESKVRDLFREVSSLKEQLEQREETVQSLTKEKLKYRGFQDLARKHLKEFHESERKVRELTANCNALENNIRFKDQLVEEMKKHAAERTEAMRIATEIKKDLNSCRHRELQLEQELEREKLQVKNLRWELMENSRAVKAEMALQQAEKDMLNLNKDLAILQEGIRSRDNVIKLLQENIDGNVHILKRASEDREKMRQMEEHMYRLESKLKEFL
ncbi:hypothetical protein KP509_15G049800 [Ceratopteris richardii]|nr:hypothetical protein KP509_15G049800 [Ceratopteris richardii]